MSSASSSIVFGQPRSGGMSISKPVTMKTNSSRRKNWIETRSTTTTMDSSSSSSSSTPGVVSTTTFAEVNEAELIQACEAFAPGKTFTETVVYFVARSASGEDDISQLALRAENYAARVAWIDANAEFIRDAMRAAGRVD